MADAPVFIAQYDPAWLAGFDAEAARVAVVSAAGIELPTRDRLPE